MSQMVKEVLYSRLQRSASSLRGRVPNQVYRGLKRQLAQQPLPRGGAPVVHDQDGCGTGADQRLDKIEQRSAWFMGRDKHRNSRRRRV
jgi:hypothetical protein